ncbi:hypothetical protein ACFYPC_33660 [Streptomyces sp. NPDC005808]|uniref:hypothetical protein n=1 Tax=Streptomyces sp. NPDC005808 TaxID=3364734 RepID=UPI003699B489
MSRIPLEPQLNSDPEQRAEEYRKAARNARLRAYALLETAGLKPGDADALVSAIEAGAVARALSDAERGVRAPEAGGEACAPGWADGAAAVRAVLLRTADQLSQTRGRAASAARSRAGKPAPEGATELEKLRAFARQALHRTHPHTMQWRQVREMLGESTSLCNARTIEYSTGDVIRCTRDAGHYDPDMKPEGDDPGGWHLCNARRWIDNTPYNHPHTAA